MWLGILSVATFVISVQSQGIHKIAFNRDEPSRAMAYRDPENTTFHFTIKLTVHVKGCWCNFTNPTIHEDECSIKINILKSHMTGHYSCVLNSTDNITHRATIDLIVLTYDTRVLLSTIDKPTIHEPNKFVAAKETVVRFFLNSSENDLIQSLTCTVETNENRTLSAHDGVLQTEINEIKLDAALTFPWLRPVMNGLLKCIVSYAKKGPVTWEKEINIKATSTTEQVELRRDGTNHTFNCEHRVPVHQAFSQKVTWSYQNHEGKSLNGKDENKHSLTLPVNELGKQVACHITSDDVEECVVTFNITVVDGRVPEAKQENQGQTESKGLQPSSMTPSVQQADTKVTTTDNFPENSTTNSQEEERSWVLYAAVGGGVIGAVAIGAVAAAAFAYVKLKAAAISASSTSPSAKGPDGDQTTNDHDTDKDRYSLGPGRVAASSHAPAHAEAFKCPIAVVAPLPGDKKKKKREERQWQPAPSKFSDDDDDVYHEIGPFGTVIAPKESSEKPPPDSMDSLSRALPPVPTKPKKKMSQTLDTMNSLPRTLPPAPSKPIHTKKPISKTLDTMNSLPRTLPPAPSKPIHMKKPMSKTLGGVPALGPGPASQLTPNPAFLGELQNKLMKGHNPHMHPQPLPKPAAEVEEDPRYERVEPIDYNREGQEPGIIKKDNQCKPKPYNRTDKPLKLFATKQETSVTDGTSHVGNDEGTWRRLNQMKPNALPKQVEHKGKGIANPTFKERRSKIARTLPLQPRPKQMEESDFYESLESISSDEDYKPQLSTKSGPGNHKETYSDDEWSDHYYSEKPQKSTRPFLRPSSEHIYEVPELTYSNLKLMPATQQASDAEYGNFSTIRSVRKY